MKCVRSCPAKNITFENGEFKFGKKCLMCQRCVMYCPKDAFKSLGAFTSWKVSKPYSFKKQEEFQVEKKPKYCKKNYEKYFKTSFEKIEQYKNAEL